MFGCYRRGDANDPDTYVAAVASVLSRYDADTIKTVTDPFTGLPGRKSEQGWSGLPDVADVKEVCEAHSSRQARIAELGKYKLTPVRRLPGPKLPGSRANVFVGAGCPQYAAMIERSQKKDADRLEWRMDEKRDGIWVSVSWMGAGQKYISGN